MVQQSTLNSQNMIQNKQQASFTIHPNKMHVGTEDELDAHEAQSSQNLSFQNERSQRHSMEITNNSIVAGAAGNDGVQNIALKHSRRNSTNYKQSAADAEVSSVEADLNIEEQTESIEKIGTGQISPCKQKYTSVMDQHLVNENKDHKSAANIKWRHSSESNLMQLVGTGGQVSTV